MLSVGIISAPRNPVYLSQTLDSFFRFFDITPTVFAEPGTGDFLHLNKVKIIRHEKRLGPILNWLYALEYLVKDNKSFILLLEDDIEWRDSKNLRSYLLDKMNDEVGFISPYCSLLNRPKNKGWGVSSGKSWFGALSICMSIDKAKLLLKNKQEFISYSLNKENVPWHLDTTIGKFFKLRNYKIITHNPTLVLHLGENSTYPKPISRSYLVEETRKPAL